MPYAHECYFNLFAQLLLSFWRISANIINESLANLFDFVHVFATAIDYF